MTRLLSLVEMVRCDTLHAMLLMHCSVMRCDAMRCDAMQCNEASLIALKRNIHL